MALEPFVAKNVSPGEPITAQAWNDMVNGISALNEFIRSSQATSLQVTLANTDIDTSTVRITARRDDGWIALAIAPVNPGDPFVFTSLPQGAFAVRAEAPGFAATSANVTIPSNQPLQLTLNQDGAFMPNLIGVELNTALAELDNHQISVSRLIDVVGRELPPANPGPEHSSQPVLMQLPDPGAVVATDGKIQLVIAAALQQEESVEVPPLTGLTLTEARKALEAIGLKLGKVETRQLRRTPNDR